MLGYKKLQVSGDPGPISVARPGRYGRWEVGEAAHSQRASEEAPRTTCQSGSDTVRPLVT